jgi:hypothetical protein
MFQRDYIMRMIAQAAEAAGDLLGLRARRENGQALRFIDDWLERHLRLRLDLVDRLSADDLAQLHTTAGVPDAGAIIAVARLLREAAAVAEDGGDEELACMRRLKALDLNLRISPEKPDGAALDPDAEAEALLRELADWELPSATMRSLARWCERRGRYAEAENWLYEWLESDEADREAAAAFYRRLLELPDERLAEGGLPREEAEAGLAALEAETCRTGRAGIG